MSLKDSFQTKCRVFFDQCNGGGPIKVGQLGRVIRDAVPGFQGDDKAIVAMFMDVDENEDNSITWKEFSDALFAKNPKEVTRAELETLFKEKDSDNSGKLSKDEIRDMAKGDISEEELNKILETCDPNNDGVDFSEFLNALKEMGN